MFRLVPALVLLPPLLLLSCGDGPTDPAPPPSPDVPRPTSVSVAPASAALSALGETVQLTAEVRDQNGRPIPRATVTWTSSDDSVAAVSVAGLVRAASNGGATVTASAGPSASGTAAVTVSQVTRTVSVSQTADTLVARDTLRLAAEAFDANGHAISGTSFAWSSSDPGVATVDTSGLVTAVSPGAAAVTAASGGVSGRMELLVIAPAASAIDITPAMVSLEALGDTVRLAAEVYDQLGRVIEDAAVSWSSGDESVVTVDSTGLVMAEREGTTGITATAGEAAGTVPATVMQVVGSIVVSPPDDTVAPGDTLRLAAEAFDANGHAISGARLAWSSSDPGVATVDTSGLVTAVSPGEAVISASSGSARGQTQLLVISPMPAVISVTPETATLTGVGDTIRLTAVVFDQFGREIDGAAVSWSSDDESIVTVDATGLVRGVGEGIATITAQAGDAEGASRIAVGNADRAALVAFYHATNGPNWRDSQNWLTDAPLDSWAGVRVDEAGRVSELQLIQNNLSGPIPPEIGYLTHLRDFSAFLNGLTSLPPELGYLTNLSHLWLESNELTGPVPPELGNLNNLEIAKLNGNRLSGRIPPELGRLTTLRTLQLDSNELTGPVPSELGNLAKIERLSLSGNELTGSIPPELGNLVNVKELVLSGTELTGSIPPGLGNLANLEQLHLSSNQLTGAIPAELGNLASLKDLHLRFNKLMDAIPSELGRLTSLERLSISFNELTGPIPAELGNLANLKQLSFRHNQLAGEIPPELGNLSMLEELSLSSNQLTGGIPPELGNLANLNLLFLDNNELMGPLPGRLVALDRLGLLILENNRDLCVPGTPAFAAWVDVIGRTPPPFCNALDHAVLASLFEATGGAEWGRSDGWLESAGLADWYGVGADSLGHVLTLDLRRNGLSGRLPSSLGELGGLTELRIDGNELSGRLPVALARLSLREFGYADTGLCVPADTSLRAWLNALPVHEGTGETCGSLSERDILSAFHGVAGGTDWINRDNWLTDAPIRDWYGITVDGEGNVVEISVGDNNLTGAIPTELGSLASLKVLNLGVNQLTGSIPPELGNLAGLQVLSLADNRLTGSIPPELGSLGSLQELRLQQNELTGPIPKEIGNLAKLTLLWLPDNQLTGRIPAEIGNLANLETLELTRNRLTGEIPPELGRLRNARSVHLVNNGLTGSIPPELGSLVNVVYLALGTNQLTGSIPIEFGKLANLRSLNLWNNKLSGRIPPQLGNLPDIRSISFNNNRLTGRIPPELGNLASLERLRLSENELTGPIPATLGNLTSLERLLLNENRLTGQIPRELGRLTHLIALQLSYNAGLSGALPASLTALRGLENLGTTGTDLCAPRDNDIQVWLAGVIEQRIRRCPDGQGLSTAYLTQAVQSREFPVPLIAGDPALLRVFVAASRSTSEGIPPVRATFYLNGSETHVVEIPAQTTVIPTEVSEGDLAASANAQIPRDVIQPGLEMSIEIDPDGTLDAGLGVPRRIPETGRMVVDVREMPTLNLRLIPFLWTEAPDSAILATIREMAADPAEHELLLDTRTLLPVGEVQVTAYEPVLSSSNNPFKLYEQTRAIWAMEGRPSSHYMGMMSGTLSTQVLGVGSRPGKTSFAIAQASVIAHELGHNMSLGHVACGLPLSLDPEYPYEEGTTGSWGYDFRGGGRLVPPSAPDLMSYCFPPWISEYQFSKAVGERMLEQAGRISFGGAQSLLLWGVVNGQGEPFLEPAFVVDAPPTLPEPGGGAFELAGRSRDGTVLFSLSFDMPEVADAEGRSSFAFALPTETGWSGGLASVTLSGPGGVATLDGDTDRPMVILRNPRTGRVRGFLRDLPPAALAGGAVDIGALSSDPGLEALFSRGLPGPGEWRR